MATYNATNYTSSLKEKTLEVSNLFTQSLHWVDESTNQGILGMYDWVPTDGDLHLLEVNTFLRLRDIDTTWFDFTALNTFLTNNSYDKFVLVCDNTTVGEKPGPGFITTLSSSLSSVGIEYQKELVSPYPTYIPNISSSDANVFVCKVAFDNGNSICQYSGNKLLFNNYVSSSGLYSYQPRKYADLPDNFSNGVSVPDVVVKSPSSDIKSGNYFFNIHNDTTSSLESYVSSGYVVEEYIIPDTINGSLQTDCIRGLVLHTNDENIYLTRNDSDLRGYSYRKTPVVSGSVGTNQFLISYAHNPDTFITNTPIRMSDGSTKNVQDIVVGDIVKSYNIPGSPDDEAFGNIYLSPLLTWTTSSISNAELTSSVVTGVGSDTLEQHYLINDTYKVGSGATMFIKSGSEYLFQLPAKISVGNKLFNSSQQEVNIDSIELVSESSVFYSLDVEEIDTYFGSDILVHNLPPCFVEGTSIELADGWKPIEEVIVGDIVKTYNTETTSIIESEVTEVYTHEKENLLIIDDIIECTPNHPFYHNDEWIRADELKVGDEVLKIDGKYHKINKIEKSEEIKPVFNFEVKDTHCYFAEGYLVHNK